MEKTSCFDLKVEYLTEPLGMDEPSPRFFWKLSKGMQSAYQIEVENHFDSGKVESPENIQVSFAGLVLSAQTYYRWRVRIWDDTGTMGNWSGWSGFETGLFGKFPGKWIRSSTSGADSQPAAYFRSEFSLKTQPEHARLYLTALGMYEPQLNGDQITENLFMPGWTDYYHRVQYQTYDVAQFLRKGGNALGVILNEGWFSGKISRQWSLGEMTYGDTPAFKALLEVDSEMIELDWKYTVNGPIRGSDLYMGENYDARLELSGWSTPDYDDRNWFPAMFLDFKTVYAWNRGIPVRRRETIRPVEIRRFNGKIIVDFGQNFAGRERITFLRTSPGTEITIRHGEALDHDTGVYTRNNRGARAASIYITRGDIAESYEPTFTYYGFRYLEIQGTEDFEVQAVCIHSEFRRTGVFECSEPLLNRLYENAWWSQRSNFVDIPTDCPQRDERLGWTADTWVFMTTAGYNADVAAFFAKYLVDLELCCNSDGVCPQFVPFYRKNGFVGTAGWADAKLICPDLMHTFYGDRRVLEESFESSMHYLRYVRDHECSGFLTSNAHFGDHLAVVPTDKTFIATVFYFNAVLLGIRAAELLARGKEQEELEELSTQIRAAWSKRFQNEDGTLNEKTQAAAVLALQFHLLSPADEAIVAKQLQTDIEENGFRLTTGYLATPFLLPVLRQHGFPDTAYALLEQKEYPSWLFPVLQGATTIWERWDSWSLKEGFGKHYSSLNHYAFGSVVEFFYSGICGIRPDLRSPGFRHFFLDPQPGGSLRSAKATYETLHGIIEASWEIVGDQIEYRFTIPPNTTATLLPENQLLKPGVHNIFRCRYATKTEGNLIC